MFHAIRSTLHFAVLAVVIGTSPTALAVQTVFPTGIFPNDVENVQAALDVGGVVLLKSENAAGEPTAFDFGPAEPGVGGSTWITRDVVIVGEDSVSGRTTIRGGAVPFRGDSAVRSKVVNIRFDAPLEAAIALTASAGAVITGNEISGVVGAPFFGETDGDGISFITGDPSAFSGEILITGNHVHDLAAASGDGLHFEYVGAAVTIASNLIEGVNTNGVLMYQPGGDIAILDNLIVPGPRTGSRFSLGNGLQLNGTGGGAYRIQGNRIICENPRADGILLMGGFDWIAFEPGLPVLRAVIEDNDIAMSDSCCGAISLFDDILLSSIRRNTLRGNAQYALGLVATGAVDEPRAAKNIFAGNRMLQAIPDLAHVLFFSHTQNNLFVGPSGVVVDDGENNRFFPPHSGAQAPRGANVDRGM